jgi:hypothetical protein
MRPRDAKRRRGRAPAVALATAKARTEAGVALLFVLLCAAACARDGASSASGRIDVQAATNCAPFEYDQAAYDSCIADEKRRLNAAAINNLSLISSQTLLTVPIGGAALHH